MIFIRSGENLKLSSLKMFIEAKCTESQKYISSRVHFQSFKGKLFGVTGAISLDGSSPEELRQTADLCNVLRQHEVLGDDNSNIVHKIDSLFKQWVNSIYTAREFQSGVAKPNGKVLAYGSYRLGVNYKGADIDALCLAPNKITQNIFFDSFVLLLKQQAGVTRCRAVEEALDPAIKMKFEGTNVNLLFARLSPTTLPDVLDLGDDTFLVNLDLGSMRSLNGCQTTEKILKLVPNIETFSLALRVIIMWAKRSAVYSHALGYLDGVAWAMLVARTCQLFPKAAVATIVHRFFLLFSHWDWPRPVLLHYPENILLKIDGYLPIIKPAYPEQDLASNVSQSTKAIILKELWRGLVITNNIMLGRASWNSLFQEQLFVNFSHRYPNCLMILVHSKTSDDHLVWNDLIESKIRLLVSILERNPHIFLVHPYARTFCFKEGPSDEEDMWSQNAPSLFPSPFCTMWFVGFDPGSGSEDANIDLTEDIKTFTDHVLQHGALSHLLKEGMTMEVNHIKP